MKNANIDQQDLRLMRTIWSDRMKIFLDVGLSFRGVWFVVKNEKTDQSRWRLRLNIV